MLKKFFIKSVIYVLWLVFGTEALREALRRVKERRAQKARRGIK